MRCYFNLTNGTELIRDDEGVEVTCLSGALNHARRAIEKLRGEDPLSTCGWRGWWLEMVDSSGLALGSLPLDTSMCERTSRH
jgi:hypothetical protein